MPSQPIPSLFALLAFGTALVGAGCRYLPDTSPPSDLGERIAWMVDQELDSASEPGAAFLVLRRGEVVHASGHGLADLQSGLPITPSTPFRLASVSKAFTAMAVVILEEQGIVDYDAPITEWVPELRRFDGITVRHLLNHTSGLPSYYQEEAGLRAMAEDPDRTDPFTNADAIAVYESWGEPAFSPGSRFEYSNSGYEVLGLLIERASGKTFGEFLDAEIFEPLGMDTAVVRDHPDLAIADRAIGYRFDAEVDDWVEYDDHWANWMLGAGGVYASLEDLVRWDEGLREGLLIEDESFDAMLSTALLSDGSISRYGFGWSLDAIAARAAHHHTGGWVGFQTAIVRIPEDGLTLAVLSNTGDFAVAWRGELIEVMLAR